MKVTLSWPARALWPNAKAHMRVRRITWRPHVALWLQRWLYAELIHKGAAVDVHGQVWECRW